MRLYTILCSLALCTSLHASPSIQALEPNYRFPTVKSGDLVQHDFIITNTGTETLVISNVLTSCGCTTAGKWTTNIAPGASGSIPVTFNSFNYAGEVSKMVTIMSNDPQQPAIFVKLGGTVFQALTVKPPFLLMALSSEQTGTGEATISNQTTNAIWIKEIRTGNPAFTAVLRTNVPGFSYSLSVSSKPPYTQGFQTAVRVFTQDGKELSFLVLANAPATIQLKP